jgi:tetratricopeptide (TPR) repeat protein
VGKKSRAARRAASEQIDESGGRPEKGKPEERPPHRRWELPVLVAILVAGALLRVAYLAELKDDPLFSAPALDAQLHDYWARGLADGEWALPEGVNDPLIAETPYFRPPGYPYFLSGVYRLVGGEPVASRVAQFALGLATCLLGFVLARRWAGPVVGALFAGFLASYWSFVYFEGQLLDPVLLVFLLLASVLALSLLAERIGFARAVVSGLLLGLSALVRPNVLLFAPVAAAWIAWIAVRRADAKRLSLTVAGLFLGVTVAVAPATLRNYFVSGEWVLISSNGGVNLFIGNNPKADGVNAAIPEVEQLTSEGGWTCFDYPQVMKGLERKLGKPISYTEASRYWTREALDYIADHPGRFLALTAKRAALFWGPSEVGDRDVGLARESSIALRLVPLSFPMVLALALVGGFLLAREASSSGSLLRRQVAVLVGSLVIVYFVSFLPFFFNARYRVPVLPFLLLFGAYGVWSVARLLGSGRKWTAIGCIVAWLVLTLVASVNFAGYEPARDRWHYQTGNAYRDQGKLELAATEYLSALRLNPDHAAARNELGALRLGQGRVDEAVQEFEAALRADPLNSDARFNLANVLVRQGKIDRAIEEFRRGLDLNPLEVHARVALGSALLLRGRVDAAISEYREALRIEPGEPLAHLALGRALLSRGAHGEAIPHLTEASRSRPDDPWAKFYLGMALGGVGRGDEAVAQFQEALRLEPGFEPAARALASAGEAR